LALVATLPHTIGGPLAQLLSKPVALRAYRRLMKKSARARMAMRAGFGTAFTVEMLDQLSLTWAHTADDALLGFGLTLGQFSLMPDLELIQTPTVVICGTRDFYARAYRGRKIIGGAMRQAGVIAAAALYALDHHVERLAEDHRNALVIAQAIADVAGLRLDPPDVHTNLVWFEVEDGPAAAKDVLSKLKARGVLVGGGDGRVLRACTHLDVSAADAERAADIIRKTLRRAVAV
jgi:hypothetical protein